MQHRQYKGGQGYRDLTDFKLACAIHSRQEVSPLRHLSPRHNPPARPPPSGDSGPYTYEPCDDMDPAPDYENALTNLAPLSL